MGTFDDLEGERERGAKRVAVDESARLRPNDWSSLEVRMIDLSSTGFRARCEARLQKGGPVSLDLPGIGTVEAQVEWQRDDVFGARFFQPIDLAFCTWSPQERESSLAQLLVERAAARRAGRKRVEEDFRRQILAALPIHKGSAQA